MKLHFLIATFFFIITNSSHALDCIDTDEPIEIPDDFTLSAVQQKLYGLPVTDFDECFVQIYFNYPDQYIEIRFTGTFKPKPIDTNQEVYVSTWIEIADDVANFDTPNILNYVQFVCDYADECDYDFVLDHLEWLFKANYDQLASAISPLLMFTPTKQYTGLCFDYQSDQEQLCADGMCFVSYLVNINQIEGGCDDSSIEPIELGLISYIWTDESIYEQENQIAEKTSYIRYWCRTDHCNNQTSTDLIIKVVEDHYDMSPVYEALKVQIAEEYTTTPQGKTTISGSTNNIATTTSQGKTTISGSTNNIATTTSQGKTTISGSTNNISTTTSQGKTTISGSTNNIPTTTSQGKTTISGSTNNIPTTTSQGKTTVSGSTNNIATTTSQGKPSSSNTNIIDTTTSNINTTKHTNNTATLLHASMIMIIFNACLTLFFA